MKRYYYMDVLTILATIAVVFLHSSEYAFSNQTSDPHWIVAVILQVTFIWAVPIFFMMSGAHLLDYRERYDTKTFFKKRLNKILVPFLFWSILWYLITPVIWSKPANYRIDQFVNGIMHNQIQPIFWFFYVIIGFYISVPLVSKITNKNSKQLTIYLLAINVFFVTILSYYYSLRNQPMSSLTDGIQIGTAGSIGFFVTGWYLKHETLSKFQRILLHTSSIISFSVMIALTLYLSIRRGEFQRNVYSIWGIFGFIFSVGVFEIFKYHLYDWQPSKKMKKMLTTFSSTSLGVYIVHEFFIYFAEIQLHIPDNTLRHMLIMPIIVWILSTIFVIMLQKIPLVNKLV
ncbi:acyltransferase [Leuconostoc mesenteroides]|uniref:acyltransferase n=1 Tax=Leuconostoc mesenteroides TaxID=1245 RepID=UPI0021A2D0E1|nr:acyltransferase family protein [Leuconostoc mesenteroides]MCT3046188.1 acyltransferase [Leuconostoc mesenteroides]